MVRILNTPEMKRLELRDGFEEERHCASKRMKVSPSHPAPVSSTKRPPSPKSMPTKEKDKTEVKSFHDLGIIKPLVDACTALGWTTPTAIQKQAIPLALQNKDLVGLAETGSGKTAAFALPVLQCMIWVVEILRVYR